jgi:hypothetical protein
MVAFFVWTITLGKILTHDNLRKRNVVVSGAVCVKRVGSQLNICYFIAKLLVSYGVIFLLYKE